MIEKNIHNFYGLKHIIIKHIMFLLIVAILLVFGNCKKSDNTIRMYYDETYCADPWGYGDEPDEIKKENVEKYFERKGIKIFKTEITDDGTKEFCYSCGCKTGKRIKCKVLKKHAEAMRKEKFYQ